MNKDTEHTERTCTNRIISLNIDISPLLLKGVSSTSPIRQIQQLIYEISVGYTIKLYTYVYIYINTYYIYINGITSSPLKQQLVMRSRTVRQFKVFRLFQDYAIKH